MNLLDCGHEESDHSNITRGYGIDMDGKKHCYMCCAELDKKTMREKGAVCLYLTKKNGESSLSNWPSSFVIPIHYVRKGKHNIAGSRYDVWFKFEGNNWHGTQYGENTQICHCKQVK